MLLCLLGVVALSSAGTIHSTDTFAEVIDRFLPGLVKRAQEGGGPIKDRYMKVDFAFYDLARALVNLRQAAGMIDDAPRRMDLIDQAERLDAQMFESGPF